MYYRVNFLKFLHTDKLSEPFGLLRQHLVSRFDGPSGSAGSLLKTPPVIICTEAGGPTIQNWWGTITDRVYDVRDAIGTCSRPFDKAVVDEPAGLWIIVMMGPIFSLIALFLLRHP